MATLAQIERALNDLSIAVERIPDQHITVVWRGPAPKTRPPYKLIRRVYPKPPTDGLAERTRRWLAREGV